MSASPVLVDSCYYIEQLRNGCDPLRRLALTAVQRDLVVCGVVECEVGRGLRDRRILEKFQAFWDAMINVPTDSQIWDEALGIAWDLDRRGIILPLSDLIVGCCARRAGAVVLTLDQHFQIIPGVQVIRELS